MFTEAFLVMHLSPCLLNRGLIDRYDIGGSIIEVEMQNSDLVFLAIQVRLYFGRAPMLRQYRIMPQ